jgi:hypothetical protein
MLLAKLGILLQIKRIFGGVRGVKTYLFWATSVVIAIVTSAYVATIFLLIFACNPIKKAWTPFLEGKCHDSAAGIVSGIVNVVSDFLIKSLPIWEIYKLQLSLQKKIGVGAIFGTGLLLVFPRPILLIKTNQKSAPAPYPPYALPSPLYKPKAKTSCGGSRLWELPPHLKSL